MGNFYPWLIYDLEFYFIEIGVIANYYISIITFLIFCRKNFFGKAFEQTVKNTQTRFLIDYWDSSLIQVEQIF